MRATVLIVGERPQEIESVISYLGVKSENFTELAEALCPAAHGNYELIIVVNPYFSNRVLDFCVELRKLNGEVPLAVSCRQAEAEDRALALNAGADEFLAAEVSRIELIARLGALLRRFRIYRNSKVLPTSLRCYQIDDLEVDVDKKEARLKGMTLKLTPTEYTLLEALAISRGKTISHSQLSDTLWGYDSDVYLENIKWHVSRLRKKLGTQENKYIVTVRSKGYRLLTSEERATLD